MKLKSLLLGSALFCAAGASAQQSLSDETKGSLSIHGNVDVYYKHTFHGLKDGTTSFTPSDQRFELGMASLQLTYETKKMGAVVDLGFGPRARDFGYTDQGAMAAIKQAYIYFEPVTGLRFSAGAWATHIGYEVLDPAFNANYSMSYLFSTGPFSNTGLKAEYTTGSHHLMLGLSNPTDYRHVPDGVYNRKTVIARYSYEKQSGLILALNYSGGKQIDTVNLQQLDAVATVPLTEHFQLGWNGSVVLSKQPHVEQEDPRWQHFWGQAVYLKARLNQKLALALREEYFEDKKAISVVPLNGSVWSSTATLRYEEGPVTIMPEIRWDHFSTPYGADPHQGQLYGLIAMTFQF